MATNNTGFFDVDKEMSWYKDSPRKLLHTENASKSKMGANNPRAKRIYQYTKDGVFVKDYDCVVNAALENGYLKDTIYDAINPNRKKKTAYGYVWSYTPPENIQPFG